MITDALLKKTVEIFTIKTRKKKKRIMVLILLLNLPFNFIEFKSVRVYIIIMKSLKGADLIDLIKSES